MMWGPRCHLSAHIVCLSLMWVRAGRAVTCTRARALRCQAGQAGAEECWAAGGDPARALETGDKPQPVISQEGTRRAVGAVCRVRTQSYKGDMWALCAVTSSDQQRLQHDVGQEGEAEIERPHTWPELDWSSGPGRLEVFCVQLTAERSTGQTAWDCEAQVGGEIGQRHGNIYESNYFGTELGETQGFSYSLIGKWWVLAYSSKAI